MEHQSFEIAVRDRYIVAVYLGTTDVTRWWKDRLRLGELQAALNPGILAHTRAMEVEYYYDAGKKTLQVVHVFDYVPMRVDLTDRWAPVIRAILEAALLAGRQQGPEHLAGNQC